MPRVQPKPLSLLALIAAVTLAQGAVSVGTDVPVLPPSATGDSPAKPALEAFREGRHAAAVDLAKPVAESGNADALFLLGFAAETGQGLTASRADALEYYKKAADAGKKEAVYRRALILLNSQDDNDRQAAREALEAAAQSDPAKAGRILGEAWLRGLLGDKPDHEKAAQWWKTASDAGDTPSILLLARLHEGALGSQLPADPKKALDLFRKAATLGDENALIPLGSRLLNGREDLRNEKEGREWLAKAIEKNQSTAHLALGDFEENVKKDDKAAIEQYRKGAEAGQPDCMYRLAAFHFAGRGTDKDPAKGREWLAKSAEAGNSIAAMEMASLLANDETPDIAAAYKYLLSAANSGTALAQNELGLLYLSGKLGLSDPTASAAWFTRAAKSGYAPAQNNLATLYERGMGVAVDFTNAGQLYSLAANQGHAEATTGLARLHAYGLGTETNLPKAWALASLAVERGDESAKTLLGDLTSKLDEPQLAEARRQLEELKKPAEPANESDHQAPKEKP